jgi:hypothetical protein
MTNENKKTIAIAISIILIAAVAFAYGGIMAKADFAKMSKEELQEKTKIFKYDNFVEIQEDGIFMAFKSTLYIPNLDNKEEVIAQDFIIKDYIPWSQLEDCVKMKTKNQCKLELKQELIDFAKNTRQYYITQNESYRNQAEADINKSKEKEYPFTKKELEALISDDELNK